MVILCKMFHQCQISPMSTNGYAFILENLPKILPRHLSRDDMRGLTVVNFDGVLHAMNVEYYFIGRQNVDYGKLNIY